MISSVEVNACMNESENFTIPPNACIDIGGGSTIWLPPGSYCLASFAKTKDSMVTSLSPDPTDLKQNLGTKDLKIESLLFHRTTEATSQRVRNALVARHKATPKEYRLFDVANEFICLEKVFGTNERRSLVCKAHHSGGYVDITFEIRTRRANGRNLASNYRPIIQPDACKAVLTPFVRQD